MPLLSLKFKINDVDSWEEGEIDSHGTAADAAMEFAEEYCRKYDLNAYRFEIWILIEGEELYLNGSYEEVDDEMVPEFYFGEAP